MFKKANRRRVIILFNLTFSWDLFLVAHACIAIPIDVAVPETFTKRVVRTIKKADMYTKVQAMHSNIITPTPMGAIVSIIVVFVLLYLFVGELSSYTQVANEWTHALPHSEIIVFSPDFFHH